MLQEKFLTVKEAAERLGVTPVRVYQFISEGRLKAIKIHPKAIVIREDHLEEFSQEERKPGRPPKNGDSR